MLAVDIEVPVAAGKRRAHAVDLRRGFRDVVVHQHIRMFQPQRCGRVELSGEQAGANRGVTV